MSFYDSFFHLIRLGIGNSLTPLDKEVEWIAVKALAEKQGLLAVVLDGIEKLLENKRPSKTLLLSWIGEVLRSYDQHYILYRDAIKNLAGFYNKHDLRMMVLKGYSCALDWYKPEHRPCGDIDIWLFGDYKKGDDLIIREKGLEIDSSHHHHTVFLWGGFMVENHYDFINIHHHKSNVEIDKLFKSLAFDNPRCTVVDGEMVYLPSPNLNALFLLRHSMNHFASSEISLRHLLDWAFFVEKNGKEVNWGWLKTELDLYGMTPLFHIFNAICVEELGFSPDLFPIIQYNPLLKDKVLSAILSPGFSVEEPKQLLRRVIFKFKRWKSNGWKHELCYNESMLSAFLSGIWSHILKPSSI